MIHDYAKMGVSLKKYHKEKRREFIEAHPGHHKRSRTSGRPEEKVLEAEIVEENYTKI